MQIFHILVLCKIKISHLTDIVEQVTSEPEVFESLPDTIVEESEESKVQDESEPRLPYSICGEDKSQLIEKSIN